jgi:uncharacterized membrane protein
MANVRNQVHIVNMTPVSPPAPILHMDAILRPQRSLSKKGFLILLSILAVYNLLVAVFLWKIGAFPVPVFLGLDFLGVYIAFRVSYGRAKASERIQVTADQVRVSHQFGRMERTVWTSPTAFTRVQLEGEGDQAPRLRLRLSSKAINIATALGPKERADFATALHAALHAARSERYSG